MKTVCNKDLCTGCSACVSICPKNAIAIQDEIDAYNAVIEEEKCIECGLCHKVCPNNKVMEMIEPQNWYQGWANDNQIRTNASSGGLASEISRSFIERGGIVCGCSFAEGEITYSFAKTQEEIKKFAGSKYVKSNPKTVFKEIQVLLKEKNKVLFIGLPCHVAGLKSYINVEHQTKLYTIDLICHGTPSPKLLDAFLEQYRISIKNVYDIQFRHKAKYQALGTYKAVISNGVSDRYSIAFLNSLIYTENCYSCKYATLKRVSDITLGDSWGSKLELEEHRKGISLILCQTEKGKEMLQKANIHLEEVDIKNAIKNNQQLSHPAHKDYKRELVLKEVLKGKRFNRVIMKYLPKQCLRQDIKRLLIKVKVFRKRETLDYGIRIRKD